MLLRTNTRAAAQSRTQAGTAMQSPAAAQLHTPFVALLALVLSALLAVALSALPASVAFADEVESSGNKVNANQLPDGSFLYDVPISELVTADTFHNDQTVQIEGEVVGDFINDSSYPGYGWITLQEMGAENPSVVSVYLKKDLVSQVDSWGHYGQQGTTLQIRGTFHLSCHDHQGATDLHADTITVVATGQEKPVEVVSGVYTLAAILPIVGLILLVYLRSRIERER